MSIHGVRGGAARSSAGSEEERLPRAFGPYRLERRLGGGGTADVFLAVRPEVPEAPLALKRLRVLSGAADVEPGAAIRAFLAAAGWAAALDHPHLVPIEDFGQVEDAPFLVMPLLSGVDLRRLYNHAYAKGVDLPLFAMVRVVADLARGLAHLHRARDPAGVPLRLVHGDVCPQNLFVRRDGRAQVLDFGQLAPATSTPTAPALDSLRRSGSVVATAGYLAPERLKGLVIDHRADVFSLAVVLFELTTGHRLFRRRTEVETLQAVWAAEVPAPSEIVRGYPRALEASLRRALAADPEARHPSADAFADELEASLSGSPEDPRRLVSRILERLLGPT